MPDVGNIPILSVKSISTNQELTSAWKPLGMIAAALAAAATRAEVRK
jgi:hypothetical protein